MSLQPPFSTEQMSTFKNISDNWLGSRKGKRVFFRLFSEDYLTKSAYCSCQNTQEEIVAFATIIPTYTDNKVGTIGLMRYDPKKHLLAVWISCSLHLFAYMKKNISQWFNLGMAPLQMSELPEELFFTGKELHTWFYEFGSHFYSFHGLREYKKQVRYKLGLTLYSRLNTQADAAISAPTEG